MMYYVGRGLFGVMLLIASLPGNSQPNNKNFWYQYSGAYWFNSQWSAAAHLQYRTYEPVHDLRVGFAGTEVQFKFKEAPVSVAAGYAHLFNRNYVSAEETNLTHENRLYQQISIRGKLWKTGIIHRYQVEERWLAQGYQTRFRYSLALRVPLFSTVEEQRSWYGILRNEVRVIVRDEPFDSNRIATGLGYTFSKHLSLEGMWMSQLAGGGNHQHFTMFILKHDFGRIE